LASTILQKNQNAQKKINLKGIGIGNGWVNPYYQVGSYGPYLYAHNLINLIELDTSIGVYDLFKGLVDLSQYLLASDVGNGLLELLMAEAGVNDVYDIRQDSDPTDPYADALDTYLNSDTAKKLFNVTEPWTMCATGPYIALINDEMRSSEDLFPDILSQIKVLLYNGYYDLICNWMGTDTWSSTINWQYHDQFNSAKNQTWIVNGKNAGFYKTYSTLTFLVVDNAGHMSPFDQPQNLHEMVYRFIYGSFSNNYYGIQSNDAKKNQTN